MYIDINDSSGVTRLNEMIPGQAPGINVFEGLTFESCNPGGFTVGNFTLHRKVTQYWPDLLHRNQIKIGEGEEVYWEGYIDKPIRKIRPDTFDVACQGWSARLNQLWATADITVSGAGDDQCSDFINTVMLLDTNINIIAGTIETSDYAFPVNTKFEWAPATYYFDCIEQFNAANNYDWGVWLDKRLDFTAKTPSVIDWYVWTRDCEDLSISPNPDTLCNYVMVDFVQGGSYHEQVILQDAASQLLYGIRKKKLDIPGLIDESSVGPANPGGATHIGNTYLADSKDPKVAAEFTTNRIFDSYGAKQPLGKVRGGDNVHLVDWMPTEELLTGVNDIATFQIKSAKYDHSRNTLDITPTEFLPRTDIMIARLQATGY